jgi:hypothetical protein
MKDLLSRIPLRRRRGGAVRTDGSTTPIAGIDPATAAQPSFRDRGRLRRRLRYLRRVRELGFRDLGGLVFDQHRFNRPNEDLVRSKLGALQAVDGELRALEAVLDDARPIHELREPGISACVRCGTLHGSDANFCPNCGAPISGPRAVGEIASAPAAEAATAAATTDVPPAPAARPAAAGEPAAEQPTEVVQPAHDGS